MDSRLDDQVNFEVLRHIGSFLAKARRLQGWSVVRAGAEAYLDRETIRRVENPTLGERAYSIKSLLAYLKALGLDSDLISNFQFSTEAVVLKLSSPVPSAVEQVKRAVWDNRWVIGVFEEAEDGQLLVLGDFPGADAARRFLLGHILGLKDIVEKTTTHDVLQRRKGVDLRQLLAQRAPVAAVLYRCNLRYQESAAQSLLSIPEVLEVMDIKGEEKDLLAFFGGKSRESIANAVEAFADPLMGKAGIWWKSRRNNYG